MRTTGLISLIIALPATASVVLGSPLCCVVDVDCCATASTAARKAKEAAEAPCCARCRADEPAEAESEPEPAEPEPQKCPCDDHQVDLSHADKPVRHQGALDALPQVEARHGDAFVPTAARHDTVRHELAPPAAPAGLTLPLLL